MDKTSFQIMLEQVNNSGQRLEELPVEEDFFVELSRYQNFLTQLAQITRSITSATDEEMDALRAVQDRHARLESKLEEAKNAVRNTIMKKNAKGTMDKKYGAKEGGEGAKGALDKKT